MQMHAAALTFNLFFCSNLHLFTCVAVRIKLDFRYWQSMRARHIYSRLLISHPGEAWTAASRFWFSSGTP